MLDDYYETWVHAESITYISSTIEDSATHFKLAINFPLSCRMLMKEIAEHKKEKVKIHASTLNGFLFEELICSNMESVEVIYSKKDEAISRQPDVVAITFEFAVIVQQSNSPVIGLVKNCLYHLRPFHPVIDAVAYVEVGTTPWLLLIQVSLSAYTMHETKLNNLFDDVKGPKKC